MRQVRTVATLTESVGGIRRDLLLAVCTDDSLWVGRLETSDDHPPVVKWNPLNGPPDGEFWNKAKPFWDRLEKKLRDEIENDYQPDSQ